MLQACSLACARGDRELFSDISFSLTAGDALQVAGANGSGKTSLLRMLCGLTSPARGEVRWHGQNIRRLREAFFCSLVFVGHAAGVKGELLAWENLVVACAISGRPTTPEGAYRMLESVGLGDVAGQPVMTLSEGQRKRVALARLGVHPAPPLWVLDEPFSALDQDAAAMLRCTVNAHLANGGIVAYSAHQDIELTAKRMLRVDLGRDAIC